MWVGPLSVTHFEKIKSILEKSNCSFEVSYEKELFEESTKRPALQGVTPYPTYQGTGDFLFLKIESKDALLIRGECEKLGLTIGSREIQPIPEIPEYLCTECKYVAHAPGNCPKHNTPLLEFSDWNKFHREKPTSLRFRFVIVAVIAILAFIFFRNQN